MQRLNNWVRGFLQYRGLLRQLVMRDLKIKYRRSFLGYLWSVLNPLMIMLVMTVVFSTMFRRNIENFPVYLLSGQVMFNFMTNSTNQGMRSILGSAALLKKTYVPKYIFTLAKVTSCLVDFLLSLGALALVMLFTGVRPTPYLLLAPLVLMQLYVFCVGVGLFLAQATVFFRDIQYIYSVITMAWMYLTPIFYPVDMLPERLQGLIKLCNPMYCYISQFRGVVLYGWMPAWHLWAYGSLAALLSLTIGIVSFLRSQDRFILFI
ncbi:ABC transporter permease [Faecalicatena sp. BF-R-105]|uniref:Transport permease protein n=1 Tax=Yanshouia hominis TaxID=2763673 RepID=A0ABR7NMP0_9FIRM|nr:ABC transporter permease [Yanshouia hominis]MBC8577480.1 ABC transporter permease [Yanshouia hominis]MCM0707747.1 ABC transporter permease [Faecalicatena sp. BF-R-105]